MEIHCKYMFKYKYKYIGKYKYKCRASQIFLVISLKHEESLHHNSVSDIGVEFGYF